MVPSGPFSVSGTGDAGCSATVHTGPESWLIRSHKGRWSIKTAGRWPWKSESSKECVTTHRPNLPAPKMDGAEARPLPYRGM